MSDDSENWWNIVANTIAIGIAIGLAILGACLGLSVLAPAVGLGWAIATTGTVSGLQIASWLQPWLAPCVATAATAGGGACVIYVVSRVVAAAQNRSFEIVLTTLVAANGILVGAVLEFIPDIDKITKVAFASVCALAVLAGGVLFQQRGVKSKIFAAVLHLVPPLGAIPVAFGGGGTTLKGIAEGHYALPQPQYLIFLVIVLGLSALSALYSWQASHTAV